MRCRKNEQPLLRLAPIASHRYHAHIETAQAREIGAVPSNSSHGDYMGSRAVLEQISHRLVVRRRLPAPFTAARIYASSEGGLRYLRLRMDQVDPVLLRLVSETVNPGDTVWDIGANVGLFSFAAAVAAGPAAAFCPSRPIPSWCSCYAGPPRPASATRRSTCCPQR